MIMITSIFAVRKLEDAAKMSDDTFSLPGTVHDCDDQIDRQTNGETE